MNVSWDTEEYRFRADNDADCRAWFFMKSTVYKLIEIDLDDLEYHILNYNLEDSTGYDMWVALPDLKEYFKQV